METEPLLNNPIKQKRKYTKKVKFSEVKAIDSLEEKMNELSVVEEEDIAHKSSVTYTTDPNIYIYYEGHNIDTLKYIKELQEVAEMYRMKSQVVICATDRYEHSVKLNNCFFTDQKKDEWTWLCLSRKEFCAVFIKERPHYSPAECFEKLKLGDYTDDFIIVKDVV